ncbi:MAG: hypothetical protein Q9174_000661 [Haloplaca sp. 1 TL-2023]
MSFVVDQIHHIDSQLDRLHWARQSSASSSPVPSTTSDDDSNAEPRTGTSVDSVRIQKLQAAIKVVSTIGSKNAPLPAELIQGALNYADLPTGTNPIDEDELESLPKAVQDLQWLLVSKATAQVYGLIINILLEQTLPLGQDVWYWDEVLASPFFLALYSIQTAPPRFWKWSKSVYHEASGKLYQSDEEKPDHERRQAIFDSKSWSKFYALVKNSIRDRSMKKVHSTMGAPLMLYRSEVQSKHQRLKRFREMSACGLGILVDEGMNLDVDELGVSRAKGHKNEWKTVVLKSVSLMETVLRNLTMLDLGIHDFEDTVFMSVEDDAELTHVSTADADSNERLALMVNRLQLILQAHLPDHMSSTKQIVTAYGRPSHMVRYWLPATALLLSSSTLLQVLFKRKADVVTWIRDLGATTVDFWYNWVVDPVRKVIATIRHDKDSGITIMSKESLEGDRASLERMVVDFAKDNPTSTDGSTGEAELASIQAKVREGDLTPVLRAYEKDLRRPFVGTIRGDLIRALLIQIQKTKVDVEVAVGGIDALLKSQELVFG